MRLSQIISIRDTQQDAYHKKADYFVGPKVFVAGVPRRLSLSNFQLFRTFCHIILGEHTLLVALYSIS